MEWIKQTGIERNFSDRFLAKASGTVIGVGNSVDKVFDTLRKVGIVDEADYPDVKTPQEYYQEIPQELFDKANDILEEWIFYREWIDSFSPKTPQYIEEALNETTLPVTVRYASGDGILSPVGDYNHEVLLYGLTNKGHYKIFDHYTQVKKIYHKDYRFGSILKPTLKLKSNFMSFIPKDNELYLLVEGKEQKLAMGLNHKLIVYDEKIDTLINSASRSKKYQIPTPITLEQWKQVDKLNGKGELVESKII